MKGPPMALLSNCGVVVSLPMASPVSADRDRCRRVRRRRTVATFTNKPQASTSTWINCLAGLVYIFAKVQENAI